MQDTHATPCPASSLAFIRRRPLVLLCSQAIIDVNSCCVALRRVRSRRDEDIQLPNGRSGEADMLNQSAYSDRPKGCP